jgi:hypothetical protein
MGFLDKARSAAEQAANKAKETAEDVQTKRELGQTYDELGHTAFELIESGEVSHARLAPLAEKIPASWRQSSARRSPRRRSPPDLRRSPFWSLSHR